MPEAAAYLAENQTDTVVAGICHVDVLRMRIHHTSQVITKPSLSVAINKSYRAVKSMRDAPSSTCKPHLKPGPNQESGQD